MATLPRRLSSVEHCPARAQIEAARPVLDQMRANVFVADLDLVLFYANPRALETLETLDTEIRRAFGVAAKDIVGGSIHRFHRDPARVERILRAAADTLPHQARFEFGDTMLDTRINALHADGRVVGYIVSWEDVSEVREARAGIAELDEHLRTAATAVEEVGTSISEVARDAANASQVAGDGVSTAQEAAEMARSLGQASAEIDAVTETITTIADQTNLLALNATIEAARAGEAGKGFAVVAEEVKELARSTTDATGDISKRIDAVQQQVDEVVKAIEGVTEVIGEIRDLQSSIASAAEEQDAVTTALAGNVGEASQSSSRLARGIEA